MPEVVSSKKVKANKDHICSACHSKIKKGEEYERSFVINDGDLYAWKQCKWCEPLIQEMLKEYELAEWSYDDLHEYVRDTYKVSPMTKVEQMRKEYE